MGARHGRDPKVAANSQAAALGRLLGRRDGGGGGRGRWLARQRAAGRR
eukprot:SAG11_NODE_19233_length_471_cov_1.024194_1_plen_47_part_10